MLLTSSHSFCITVASSIEFKILRGDTQSMGKTDNMFVVLLALSMGILCSLGTGSMIASPVERCERLQNSLLIQKHLPKSLGIPKLYSYFLEGFEESRVPNINEMALKGLATQADHYGN